jgi:hypothetical protein
MLLPVISWGQTTQSAKEPPVFRATAKPATQSATPPLATSQPTATTPVATSSSEDSVRVEIRVNPYSASAFSKLETGNMVLVEGTVATVNFADSKLDIALNFCRIIDYYLPGNVPAKPDGTKVSAPSPKDLYGTFKAYLEKNQPGKESNAWVKQQCKSIVGKKVTWEVSVGSKLDKTAEINNLKADQKEVGGCLAEMKKPIMNIKHTDAWREGQFIHPATDAQVPAERTQWESENIKALEGDVASLIRLIKSREVSPRIVNPIESDKGDKTDEIKSQAADLKGMSKRLAEMKKTKTGTAFQSGRKEGMIINRPGEVQVPLSKTDEELEEIKALEDDIVDLCKIYRQDPG